MLHVSTLSFWPFGKNSTCQPFQKEQLSVLKEKCKHSLLNYQCEGWKKMWREKCDKYKEEEW